MWKSSNSSRLEDENRTHESKLSHISKNPFKGTESGNRDREYPDNYNRQNVRTPRPGHKSFHKEYSRDNRYSDKRYSDLSPNEDKPNLKYQKRRHRYNDYDLYSDRSYEDQEYSSRKRSEKYKLKQYSQKSEYKTSKRSNRSPRSPHTHYSPYKSHEKSSYYKSRDRSRHSSSSPRTPSSDADSPNRNRFSPPPLPPFEPPVSSKIVSDSSSKNKQPVLEKPEPVITFAQFYETKRHDGKYKDFGPDPRLAEHTYGSRLVTKFDLVNFTKNPNIDTTLDSPEFTLDVKYETIYGFNTFFQTPLERINKYLFSCRPKIEEEWWLKGTLSLLLIGIPRNWGANEILTHLVGTHNKVIFSKETLSDEWLSDSDSEEIVLSVKMRKTLRRDCTKLGIRKFMFLFGDSSVAVNEIPQMYPVNVESMETDGNIDEVKKRFVSNDQPDGMGLLLFESEEQALMFWSIMGSNLIQAYPSTMRVCPDPSGWRIYAEALSLYFQTDMLNSNQPVNLPKSPRNNTIDLLSVLTTSNPNTNTIYTSGNQNLNVNVSLNTNTNQNSNQNQQQQHQHNMSQNQQNTNNNLSHNQNRGYNQGFAQQHLLNKNQDSPGNKVDVKNVKNTTVMYVCSYISNQEEANQVAKNLSKSGVKCMYHKNSKIMSLQFPDFKTLQSMSFCHKVYTTHTGSTAQCCFLRCEGKAIPIIKRANVEHLSNSFEKNKNLPNKPMKFKPPMKGIVNVEDLNE